MSSPVAPSDIEACVPAPNMALCAAFTRALLRLPVLLAQFFAWMLDANGDFTAAFKKMLSDSTVKTGDFIFSGKIGTDTDGRLLCDGSDVSQATYPDLYAA